ncbi:MAG TPA: GNAT family acetyltransferase [Solirubrobacteraceae bacterium]
MIIEPLPPSLFDAAVALWHEVGLTRPWNDPAADLDRALAGPASTVLAGIEDGRLVATALVGHDGHRGSVYYVAVTPDARGHGRGREIMRASEQWLTARGIPKLNVMVRGENKSTAAFYAALGYGRDDVVVLSTRLS